MYEFSKCVVEKKVGVKASPLRMTTGIMWTFDLVD